MDFGSWSVNKIENGIAHYENLDGEYKTETFDFAMLIPCFSGTRLLKHNKNGADITEKIISWVYGSRCRLFSKTL